MCLFLIWYQKVLGSMLYLVFSLVDGNGEYVAAEEIALLHECGQNYWENSMYSWLQLLSWGGGLSCTGMLLQSGVLGIHTLAIIDSGREVYPFCGDSDLRTSFQFLPTAAPCYWGSCNTTKIRPHEEYVWWVCEKQDPAELEVLDCILFYQPAELEVWC